jgi:hypothetical protein
LFAQLGPRLIEGVLQAEHEPQPRKKGGMRFVRVATACGTSGGHPAR